MHKKLESIDGYLDVTRSNNLSPMLNKSNISLEMSSSVDQSTKPGRDDVHDRQQELSTEVGDFFTQERLRYPFKYDQISQAKVRRAGKGHVIQRSIVGSTRDYDHVEGEKFKVKLMQIEKDFTASITLKPCEKKPPKTGSSFKLTNQTRDASMKVQCPTRKQSAIVGQLQGVTTVNKKLSGISRHAMISMQRKQTSIFVEEQFDLKKLTPNELKVLNQFKENHEATKNLLKSNM